MDAEDATQCEEAASVATFEFDRSKSGAVCFGWCVDAVDAYLLFLDHQTVAVHDIGGTFNDWRFDMRSCGFSGRRFDTAFGRMLRPAKRLLCLIPFVGLSFVPAKNANPDVNKTAQKK